LTLIYASDIDPRTKWRVLAERITEDKFSWFAFSFILTTIAQNGLGADKGMVSAEIPPPGCFYVFLFPENLGQTEDDKNVDFVVASLLQKSLQGGEEAVVE